MGFCARLESFFRTESTTIDNYIFRLHHTATTIILVSCSILVALLQHFGTPIKCVKRRLEISEDLLERFCLADSTFSVIAAFEKTAGVDVPYPGIDKYEKDQERRYHTYYQWVCYVLFLQAILFYVPRYFWKVMEGGRIRILTKGLNYPTLHENMKVINRKQLIESLFSNRNKDNTYYFTSYAIAELMNFVNVVGQIFFVNKFLGVEFGSKVIEFVGWDWSNHYHPLISVFPRLTKCTFNMYGASGDVQRHDVMCLLPINAVNEKIYIFLWFWFVFLAVLSGLALVYRAVIIIWPKSRFMATRIRGGLIKPQHLEAFIVPLKLGDWLILNLLSKNLDPMNFKFVIDEFVKKKEEINTNL